MTQNEGKTMETTSWPKGVRSFAVESFSKFVQPLPLQRPLLRAVGESFLSRRSLACNWLANSADSFII